MPANPGLTTPPDWALCETAAGRELRSTRYAGRGRLAAWLWIGVLLAVCGYGTTVVLLGWWAGDEVLSGEVVLFLLQLAALLAGLYLATAMFRTTRYRLGQRSLAITASQPVVGESTAEIKPASIRAVIRLHGVPRPGHEYDTWPRCWRWRCRAPTKPKPFRSMPISRTTRPGWRPRSPTGRASACARKPTRAIEAVVVEDSQRREPSLSKHPHPQSAITRQSTSAIGVPSLSSIGRPSSVV